MTSLTNNSQCTNQLSFGFCFDLVGGSLHINSCLEFYLVIWTTAISKSCLNIFTAFCLYPLFITQYASSSSILCTNLTAFWSAIETYYSFPPKFSQCPLGPLQFTYLFLHFWHSNIVVKWKSHILSSFFFRFTSSPLLFIIVRTPCSSQDLSTKGYFRDKLKLQEKFCFYPSSLNPTFNKNQLSMRIFFLGFTPHNWTPESSVGSVCCISSATRPPMPFTGQMACSVGEAPSSWEQLSSGCVGEAQGLCSGTQKRMFSSPSLLTSSKGQPCSHN